MPALFIFLFKVNVALVLFCLGYYLVLRHLTFYTLNRIYLVIAILFSTLYPAINLSNFLQQHQRLTQPVQTIILNWKAPAEKLVEPLYRPNYWQWVEVIFWAGVALFAARLLMQLFSLYKLYRQSKPGQVHEHSVRLISTDIGPFSFWRSIYINPTKLSPAELKSVLEHEQVHVSQWHTLDILLAELSTIFYWFNPGVWLMKKAVRENVEFITDRKILQKGTDTKEYQYSLLSVSLATPPNTLVNNFNISTIKKRIIMMNAKRSAGYNLTRYVFLVPAVIALLLVFSFSKAEVTKKGLSTIKSITKAIATITIEPESKPAVVPAKPIVNQTKQVKPTIAITPVNLKLNTPDTLYSGKSKDGKRSMLLTSDKSLDSIGYVVNGVKASRSDLLTIDPKNIKSLDLIEAVHAKEFVTDLPDKSNILFVTTEDSAPGKAIKEKIDKSFTDGAIARAHNMSTYTADVVIDNAPHAAANGKSYTITSDNTPVAVGNGTSYSITSDNAPAMASSVSKNLSLSTITIDEARTNADVIVKKIRVNADPIRIKVDPKVKVMVSDVKIDNDVDPVITVTPFDEHTIKSNVYIKKFSSDQLTIDGPGALYIIDGKESKTLKNIEPSDIKSLSILKDGTAKKLYGEKGKNGVVVITTKKGK